MSIADIFTRQFVPDLTRQGQREQRDWIRANSRHNRRVRVALDYAREQIREYALHLDKAVLDHGQFQNTDFRHANLNDASLRCATFNGALLLNVKLKGADLAKADFRKARMANAQLTRANAENADMHEAILNDAHLPYAILKNCVFSGATLTAADLRVANATGADFQGAVLSDAKMQGTDLTGADMRGASLGGAGLDGAVMEQVTGLIVATQADPLSNKPIVLVDNGKKGIYTHWGNGYWMPVQDFMHKLLDPTLRKITANAISRAAERGLKSRNDPDKMEFQQAPALLRQMGPQNPDVFSRLPGDQRLDPN